ncbi:MAG: LytTR family transcriptional regulator [Oscillospiraceae bacterium]|nr:LytTR family transcriptional regulator [Oscillospiraceae bacterium]
MKIRIEIIESDDGDCDQEGEIIIRCKELNEEISGLQKVISHRLERSRSPKILFYKGNGDEKEEFYFPVNNVLFFETDNDIVHAHTYNDAYRTDERLYELEKKLPTQFVRVSKSTIVNVTHILSINKNLTSSSLVKFHQSHKQIYVSRRYYKTMKLALTTNF